MAEAEPPIKFADGVRAQRIVDNLWTVLDPTERDAPYDRFAGGYDAVVGNPLYHRLVWGCPVSEYRTVAAQLLAMVPAGPIIDFGCGSLVFTARTYTGHEDRLVLFDRSLAMLERGLKRLPHGRFVQGDAFAPPFVAASFVAGMSWGMLHLFGSGSPYLDRLAQPLVPNAPIVSSSLVLAGRPIGDRLLHALHRRGEAATPETRKAVERGFAARFTIEESRLVGNMLFLRGRAG